MVILLRIFYLRCALKVGLVSTKAATNRRLIPNAGHNGYSSEHIRLIIHYMS